MRYYGATANGDDRPHGVAFYGTLGALFVDRIGMELYPEPGGGGRGRGGAAAGAQAPERMHMNEPEPTPLHAYNFIKHVRERTEPEANIDVGVRATAISCMETWLTGPAGSSRGTMRSGNSREMRRPTAICSGPTAPRGTW